MPAVDVADLGRRLRSRHRATCLAAAGKLLASLAASPPGDRPPLRSLLAESIASGSPLVASACAEGLPRVFAPRARAVPAAQQQGYGWDDAATDLAGLLRAATDAARLELAVNAVGRLLEALAAARASGLSEALHEPPPFGGPRSARPHPFFVAAAQEGAWTPLISEVKRLLAAAPDAAAVRVMLEPFIGSVLLPTPENPLVSVDATFLWLRELVHALLHQARKRDSTGDHATAKYLFESAWSALRKAPLTSGGVGERWTYLTADSLVRAVVDSRSPGSPLLAYAPVLFTDVLSVACDVRAQGGVLSRCLELLAELHRAWGAGGAQDGAQDAAKPAGIPNGAAETAVVGLSFLLWTSCSAGESRIITGLLGQVVRQSGVTGYYAALAYLPVLSALPELRDEVVAETLVAIEEAASKPAACAGQPNGTPGTLSSLATTAAHIVRLRDEDITQVPDALSRLSPSWRQLFNSALLLDTVESTRTRALTALFGHLGDPDQEAMRVLPVLLRVLRRDAAPAIRLAVLTKGLPAVGAADAFSGSRVVPIAVELTKKPAAGLASAGTRALVGIWKLQPRAWPALRECLTGWVRQRKARDSGHERRKLSPLGKSGVAAEIAAVTAMRDICVSKAAEHGDQLVPLLVSSLQYICLSKVGRAIALEALNLCVAAGVLEPRAGKFPVCFFLASFFFFFFFFFWVPRAVLREGGG
ncbi:MAG: hypothetical protein BJ554DRAFT_3260 [Olpidium bornovanus]|uniref:DUF3730 domain-containing protein n=1 Tax=Olpidium bornovanus TaxID=278681 RepID=A0A8H7ZPJ5_9FUNG|nr:MAG: hypothetical protein BJ554DRAFT_3260 [Olpidium bornovanus]